MEYLCDQLGSTCNKSYQFESIKRVGGGCINDGFVLQLKNLQTNSLEKIFLKQNSYSEFNHNMFEAEYKGLDLIQQTNTIRVPKPLTVLQDKLHVYLAMEYLPLKSLSHFNELLFAEQLASLHQYHWNKPDLQFGLDFDNTIGRSIQINIKHRSRDWIDFFIQNRLLVQLSLSKTIKRETELQELIIEKLIPIIPHFFSDLSIDKTLKPSLIHGDLWSGNVGCINNSTPVIFDPACYFAHHEFELAIMKMFGGFSQQFFLHYLDFFPTLNSKSKLFVKRTKLYQLYHYLNHANLFGSGYVDSCYDIVHSLL